MRRATVENYRKNILIVFALLLLILVVVCVNVVALSQNAFAQSVGEIDYEIDYVPIEELEVIMTNDKKSVKPGESIKMGVNIYPWYAETTVQKLEYYIYDNGELLTRNQNAQIICDTLSVFPNAIVNDVIPIVAVADNTMSAIYELNIDRIPVERVSFDALTATIGQGEVFDLPINVEPYNASFQTAIYKPIAGEEFIEYIEGNQIKINNFIGKKDAKIILSALVDDVVSENNIELSIYVPVDSVSLSVDNKEPNAGERVEFSVGLGYASASEYSFTVVSGEEYIESFIGNSLLIKSNITVENPTITLFAVCEGIKSNRITLDINIPLQKIVIKGISSINEGSSYQFGTPIFSPTNATHKNYKFSLASGSEYANITPAGLLTVNKIVNVSNARIIVKATEITTNISSNSVEVSVIVPVKSISLSVSKTRLVSTSTSGDSLTLIPTFNSSASNKLASYVIESGNSLVKSINGNTLSIDKNISGGIIKLYAQNGNVKSNSITIEVYVPVESITFNVSTLERGKITKITPTFNDKASDKRWTVLSVYPSNVLVDSSVNTITVPNSLVAGTKITVSYRASETNGINGTVVFSVAKLNGTFTLDYSRDSDGYSLSNSSPQLKTGKSITITPKYNGSSLPSNVTASIYTASNASYNGLVLTAGNVAGNAIINYTVKIYDGAFVYDVSRSISVFRQLTGQPTISNSLIYNKETVLSLSWGSLDSNATGISLGNLKFVEQNGSNYSLTSGGLLTIKASQVNPSVQVSYTQYYNGQAIPYKSNLIGLSLKKYTVYQYDGISYAPESVVAVNGVTGYLRPSTRPGYIFGGYYVSTTSRLLWDASGNRTGEQFTSSYSTLYAKWTPVSYTLIKSQLFNDKEENITTTTTTYGTTYAWGRIDSDEWTFEGWYLKDENGERLISEADTYCLSKPNIRQDGTSIVKVYSKYTKPGCIANGTLITLANGTQKAVEELDGTEMLLVWNLFTGKFDSAPITFIDNEATGTYNVINLHFSDETVVKVITEHGFWCCELNQYVMIRENNASDFIGNWFAKETVINDSKVLQKVQLVRVDISEEENRAWSPVTFGHLCYFVNGMLSMPGATEGLINIFDVNPETMRYDETQMKLDILKYGLFTYEDFADIIPCEIFEAFGGEYLKVSIGKGLIDMEKILDLVEHYSKFLVM